jgi:succinate dehydrogenase flavin-adding protein (antitoxin of CptAB toxin-antitoxin module)
MNKIGVVKSKILKKLTESFSTNDKSEMKTIVSKIVLNKEFKEMYLFYEEIENKYFDNVDTAKLYVEELNLILKNKTKNMSKFYKELNENLKGIETETNELYSYLDQLSEDDNLSNLDKKVIAKKKLVEHLTNKKETKIEEGVDYTSNENLLYSVLANNFNALYSQNLNEEQKEELKNILSMSDVDLNGSVSELKETILSKVNNILNEDTETELASKLTSVISEVNSMETTKYNYYRLKQLKDGLD